MQGCPQDGGDLGSEDKGIMVSISCSLRVSSDSLILNSHSAVSLEQAFKTRVL